jgi:flagellar FliL protein
MADDATEEHEEKEKKSGGMLIVVIIVVFVLILMLGAVAVFLLNNDSQQVQQVEPQAQQQTKKRKIRKHTSENNRALSEIGILYPLEGFTVNLKSDQGRRFLKATMSLELNSEEMSLELNAKDAVIRDKVIRILTSKTLEEITSKKGKQKVSEQIVDTLNTMVSDGSVQGLYFTEFVIQ